MPEYEPDRTAVERMANRLADMHPVERALFVLRHAHTVAVRAAEYVEEHHTPRDIDGHAWPLTHAAERRVNEAADTAMRVSNP